jgi:hypothetical protein
MREREIEAYLVERVKQMGGIAYKFTSPQRRGVPDRLVMLPERTIFFVELKAPGARPTRQQHREHDRIRALGHRVEVADSIARVDEVLS